MTPEIPQNNPERDDFGDLPGEDAELMNAIKAAVRTIHPDERFAAQLESELSGAAETAPARPSTPAGPLRRWAAAGAWVALALVVMFGLGWAIQNLRASPPEPGSAMQGGGISSPAPDTAAPTQAQEAPRDTPEPAPTDIASAPTNGPEPASEPQLYLSPYFENDVLILTAPIPTTNAQYGVYTIVAPSAPGPDSVRALASQLGIENAGVFSKAVPGQNFVEYTASNGKQRLSFYYANATSFDYIADYQRFGAQTFNLPSSDVQTAAAEDFLRDHGLLDFPYTVTTAENWPGRILFTRLVEGIALQAQNSIVVNIGEQGEVRQVTYNPPVLEKAGDFPIRTAAEAWQLVVDGQSLTGLYISGHSEVPFTLQTWMRTYEPGEQVQMVGILEVLQPADGGQAQVFLNNILLTGSINGMADLSAGETAVQLWGTAQSENDSIVIDVLGWQTTPFQPEVLQGPVVWEGETAYLDLEGARYRLPGLPTDAPGRQPATVYGVRVPNPADGGSPMIDWSVLSSGEAGGGGGGSGPEFAALNLNAAPASEAGSPAWPAGQTVDLNLVTGRQIEITEVGLVYFVPKAYYSPWAEPAAPGFDYVQPVWRFAGKASGGSTIEILVQAIPDAYLVK